MEREQNNVIGKARKERDGRQRKIAFKDPFNWIYFILAHCSLIISITALVTRL